MRTLKIKVSIFLLFCIIVLGCQEVYSPSEWGTGEKLIVIQGIMDDDNNIVKVNISYANQFNSNNNIVYVDDAKVTIKDNLGNTINLHKTFVPGNYSTSDYDINIIPNVMYHIRVETAQGGVYESLPEKLPEKEFTYGLKVKSGINTTYSKGYDGELTPIRNEGVFIYISTIDSSSAKSYIRFDVPGIQQDTFQLWCCVKSFNVNSYPITEIAGVINDRYIGFINYKVRENASTGTPMTLTPYGWVLTCHAYSISEQTYLYYKRVEEFFVQDYKLFDPVPTQIIGNIRCLTDTNEIVLGNFEVVSGRKKYYGLYWKPHRDSVELKQYRKYYAPKLDICINDSLAYDSTDFLVHFGFNWVEFDKK